jgi:hypothetical protein
VLVEKSSWLDAVPVPLLPKQRGRPLAGNLTACKSNRKGRIVSLVRHAVLQFESGAGVSAGWDEFCSL